MKINVTKLSAHLAENGAETHSLTKDLIYTSMSSYLKGEATTNQVEFLREFDILSKEEKATQINS